MAQEYRYFRPFRGTVAAKGLSPQERERPSLVFQETYYISRRPATGEGGLVNLTGDAYLQALAFEPHSPRVVAVQTRAAGSNGLGINYAYVRARAQAKLKG